MQGGSHQPDDETGQAAPQTGGDDSAPAPAAEPASVGANLQGEASAAGPAAQVDPLLVGAPAPGATSAPPPPAGPALPSQQAAPQPPVAAMAQQPQRGTETWYRTDQDRYKSVHRRANPWYRRLARGIIGLSFVAAAAVGLYFAGTAVQSYLDREKLPEPGVDIPNVRSTTIQFASSAPAPQVNGTLTLDTASGAFEFVGTGVQAGTQIVSPDGAAVYIRRGAGNWQVVSAVDTDAAALQRAIGYVANDDSADDILTSHLRRGYVDLEERVEIGEGSDQLRKYELVLDTRGFDLNFPLQYRQFQDEALPNVSEVRAHALNIWLDADSVLVRVEDPRTMWSWERLAYSDRPFAPADPADSLLTQTIEVTDGTLSDDADSTTEESPAEDG